MFASLYNEHHRRELNHALIRSFVLPCNLLLTFITCRASRLNFHHLGRLETPFLLLGFEDAFGRRKREASSCLSSNGFGSGSCCLPTGQEQTWESRDGIFLFPWKVGRASWILTVSISRTRSCVRREREMLGVNESLFSRRAHRFPKGESER